jgi:hypothetical protein
LFVAAALDVYVKGATGVADEDADDALDVIPLADVAVTVNVYEVPAVSPVTLIVPLAA